MKNQRQWTLLQDAKEIHPIFEESIRQQFQTHAGLWLDKYVRDEPLSNSGEETIQPRPQLIDEVANLPIPKSYPDYYKQWEQTLKNYEARTKIASTKGRMIVHLGAESVIETSIALHHTYGTPYIPGSSLKGLAASYLSQKLRLLVKEKGETSEDYKKLATDYKILFGDQDEAGYIIFFDAHYRPESAIYQGREQPLHSDVMTVHHPKYYQGSQAPNDKQSPVPIPFLSATGHYLIALAAPDLEQKQAWIDFTFDLLAQALLDWGIGAKTSSGYGRMTIKEPPIDPVVRQIEGYHKELKALSNNSIKNQINNHYQHWERIKDHPLGTNFARAIVEKIRLANCEKDLREKPWYKELLAVID
ncbi:type III-B CRISPR module RAMP protein Cmr6 [Dictyobacter arantiisoli]|uniref:CRISPR type III-associated protein domain-containing protein n=1 Tax=Dictyobacter arantiisoli TaxID=2014874 RepID=A0A5A5TGN6_9CHLR|nr:type III-B CRISPR module RAMP protein Cmr6 [Dictyobacter arantiisoli]GCF10223.1 hypothetical protein KDI_37870 [Dictyobacter arantiisoli]